MHHSLLVPSSNLKTIEDQTMETFDTMTIYNDSFTINTTSPSDKKTSINANIIMTISLIIASVGIIAN